jgi:hypothetical protein
MAEIRGGQEFERHMTEIARMLGTGHGVRVGFLQGATYPDGTPVALIAAIHNWGAPRAGIPARPFFSSMVRDKSPEWPAAIAGLIRDNNYDARRVLQLTGEAIAGQLRQSIVDFSGVPLKPATIAKKGFDKQLVESAHMLNSIDFEVESP